MKKSLLEMCEDAQQAIDELNNLDFSKPEEDSAFCDNLDRLEKIEKTLNGEVVSQPKTSKYLM